VFLSNDAAAVVLTPAVYAATRTAGAKPLPYLLICAFIANAASFVLPISNPANLVVFGQHMPSLMHWLAQFLLPSVISILITLLVLWWTQRRALGEPIKNTQELPQLSSTAKVSAGGICLTAVALLIASGLDVQLGAPTFVCGLLTVVAVLVIKRESPGSVAKEISWQVLPLVAGLFILVEALQSTGLFHPLTDLIQSFANRTETLASFVSGSVIALLCNAVNNLPLGLVAGTIVSTAHLPSATTSSILIGVDLGPNLSITGSLATILWILALRREGEKVTAWQFMKVGLLVMPSALFGALATCIASSALTQ
jgi:arsenical pump membrane protein